MRTPEEFYVWQDLAITADERARIANSCLPTSPLMSDGNVLYMHRPDLEVRYLMVHHNLSRGEAEFILHHHEY